jgi:lipopolysaccharide/colanic/teichoic acid biosynthesis glycosyltransferase
MEGSARGRGSFEPVLGKGAAALIADLMAGTNLLLRGIALFGALAFAGAVFGFKGALGVLVGAVVLYLLWLLLWLPVRRRRRDRRRGEAFVWWGTASDTAAEANFFIKPWHGREPNAALPTFVPRDAMEPLAQGLDHERFVILTGNPTSGKSRLIYEMAKQRPGYVTFVAREAPGPGETDQLRELMEDPLGFATWEERQILVLRDMRERLIVRNLNAEFIGEWLDRHPKVSVVATLNPDDVARIRRSGEEVMVELGRLEDRAKLVEVGDRLQGQELEDARIAFPDLTDDQLTWLPSYFVSAVPLRKKFEGAETKEHPLGVGIVRAVADWQRAGVHRPAPERYLRSIAPRYLEEQGIEVPGDLDAAFEAELLWATEPVEGAAALLYWVDREGSPGGYKADAVVVGRLDSVEPSRPIPEFAWKAIREEIESSLVAHPDEAATELIRMAESAHRREEEEIRRELLELAGRLDSGSQYRRIAEVFTLAPARSALRELIEGRYGDGFRYRLRASRSQNRARRARMENEDGGIRSRLISEIYSHRWWRSGMRSAVLVSIDLLSSAFGIVSGVLVRSLLDGNGVHPGTFIDDLSRSLIFSWVAVTIALFSVLKLYKQDAPRANLAQILAAMGFLGLIGFGAAVAADLTVEAMIAAIVAVLVGAISASFADYELRQKYDNVSSAWVVRNKLQARTLLIGTERQAADAKEMLDQGISRPTKVVGYLTTDPAEASGEDCMGTVENLVAVTLDEDIARVLIVDPRMREQERQDLAGLCHLRGLQVEAIPSIADVRAGSARLIAGQSLVLMELDPIWPGNAAYAAKRTMDIVLILAAAVVVIPIWIWATLRILFFGGGRPIIVDSWRLGVGGKLFGLRRFRIRSDGLRSPIDPADQGDDAEGGVTSIGAKLRSRHFDQLPELLNVITGKMSLVGPYALPLSDHAKLGEEHQLRYVVRPGFTGPWQVCGRRELTCSELTMMDLAYLRHWTVFADLEILIRTIRLMIKGDGEPLILIEDPAPPD